MNRALPPRDRGDRIANLGRAPGRRGALHGAFRLVAGTEAVARHPDQQEVV